MEIMEATPLAVPLVRKQMVGIRSVVGPWYQEIKIKQHVETYGVEMFGCLAMPANVFSNECNTLRPERELMFSCLERISRLISTVPCSFFRAYEQRHTPVGPSAGER